MKGLRVRDVYGLLMLGSRLPSAPIRRCQKDTDCSWAALLLGTLVCRDTQLPCFYFLFCLSAQTSEGEVKVVELLRQEQQNWPRTRKVL